MKARNPVLLKDIGIDKYFDKLRQLWKAAKRANDDWTLQFTESVGRQLRNKRPLSMKQQQIVTEKLQHYRISFY